VADHRGGSAEHDPLAERLRQPDGDGLRPWWKRRSWAPPSVSISGAKPPAERMKNRVWSSDRSPASAASVLRAAVRSQVRAPSALTWACSQLSTVCESQASARSAVHGASGGTVAAIASSSRIATPMATAARGSLAGSRPSKRWAWPSRSSVCSPWSQVG